MDLTTEPKGPLDPRVYRLAECAAFRKTKERFGGLSNMSAGFPLVVSGVPVATTEALYQACRFPLEPELQEVILKEASPMTAKMKSKPHRDRTRPDWEAVKVRIMRWCLRVKLSQNWSKFSDALLETGELPIVEFSTKDAYWGAMPSEDGESLVGANILGRLLMELRAILTGSDPASLKVVEPPAISDALLVGRPLVLVLGGARPDADPWSYQRDTLPNTSSIRTPSPSPRWTPMFPTSDPSELRRKLEALCPQNKGACGMLLSYGPLLYFRRQFFPLPMVRHGNIAKVDDDGIILDMGANANPHASVPPVYPPVIPPALEATGPFFSMGLSLRVPYSAIVDVWGDERPEKLVNLWLRHAVVMAQGWTLLPFMWPPETATRPK